MAGIGLMLVAGTTPAAAATRTWDGGALDNNWMTAANRVDDLAPAYGDSLAGS